MVNRRGKRKCQNGISTIRVPVELHRFITKVGEKLELNNYEVIERMAQHFAPFFCPELTIFLNSKPNSGFEK